jgi:tripartite-type tricarboxylate transporter receptor subunit TctC
MISRAFLALIFAIALPVAAQDVYPSKPVKLIVPFPPAGGTDVLSRAIAQAISTQTPGFVFVVDNRPGAGGNIGLEAAAKSPDTQLRWDRLPISR